MPARIHPIFRRATFDAEVVYVMGEVYDRLRSEKPDLHDDVVAHAVLEAAQAGEREPLRMFDLAVSLLTAQGLI